MDRRQVEPLGDLRVTRHAAIGRQHLADVEPLEAQNVAQRVFIFTRREPPQPRPAHLRHPGGVGREQPFVEIVGDGS